MDRVEFEGHPLWGTVAELQGLLHRVDEVATPEQRHVLDQLRYDQLRYVTNAMRTRPPPPAASADAKVMLDRLHDQVYAANTELSAFLSDQSSGHVTHAVGLIDRALHRLGAAPPPSPDLSGPHRVGGVVGADAVSVPTTRRIGVGRGSPEPTGLPPPRHAKRTSARTSVLVVAALLLVIAGGSVFALTVGEDDDASSEGPTSDVAECTVLRVVTPASYRTVLDAVTDDLRNGAACLDLDVTVADGRHAEQVVDRTQAHVWITDDASWIEYDEEEYENGGDSQEEEVYPTLATSPVLFLSSPALAASIRRAGGGWAGLAALIESGHPVQIVAQDPARSGDGLVAVGGVGDAIWDSEGMDASALLLYKAFRHHRTVHHFARPALAADEIALVPEHLLRGVLDSGNTVTMPTDRTVLMRYSWHSTEVDAGDTAVRAARARLLDSLRESTTAGQARGAAHLRDAQGLPPSSGTDETWAAGDLPRANPVMDAHRVEHVFATWYPEDRKADLLIAVDVSGSMAAPAPGSRRPMIGLVRENVRHLANQLPNDARLGVWGFGSHLDGARDYVSVDRFRGLTPSHRLRLGIRLDRLAARNTGTGLHDTVLAAFRYAQAEARADVDFHVMVFTDGLNQDDPGAASAGELRRALSRLADPDKPIGLTVVKVGEEATTSLERALRPVGGEVVTIRSVHDILAAFIHLAAGGLHE